MALSPFPPEVKSVHLLRRHRHYCQVWNTWHWTNTEFGWTLSYLYDIFSLYFMWHWV